MSTNFYAEQTCSIGCTHRVHIGKRDFWHRRFTLRVRDYEQDGLPPVRGWADLRALLEYAQAHGWTLRDEYGRPATLEDFSPERYMELCTLEGEFS